MNEALWSVHKFGGTSLADAGRYTVAAGRVAEDPAPHVAVVVSAMAGITDGLIDCLERARRADDTYRERLSAMRERLRSEARALVGSNADAVEARIDSDVDTLLEILRGVALTRAVPPETLDLVSGHGELWSAHLLATHLRCPWLDAREVLVVEQERTGPRVHWDESRDRLGRWLAGRSLSRFVITGFVASRPDGIPTTLGRNGSDLSASIFAALLPASGITIWTDVDGVLSADPRRVPEAVVLPRLSYDEAMELAYFGARVLHPHTMGPAVEGSIPIVIRNASRPEHPGTEIGRSSPRLEVPDPRSAVKGFSTIEPAALVNLEGTGMIGVPGIASRLFTALHDRGISVIMISQASSEHSICLVVPHDQGEAAREAIETAFFAELHHGRIQTVEVISPVSIVAAVGDHMVHTPGVASRFFSALAKAGVNVRAVAQGASERNISVVVSAEDSTRAIRAAHAGFVLSDQTLSVGLVGPGSMGSEFLRQLGEEIARLESRFAIDVRLRGVAGSRTMVLDDAGIDPRRWTEARDGEGEPTDLDRFTEHLQASYLPHAVVVDCTASEVVAGRYADWLREGIHVITPNKKANAARLEVYEELRRLSRRMNAHYLYETTVGAGLPVIGTLRDLLQTGDRVRRVEGVLSGTLSFLLNGFGPDSPWSELVRDARERGYTEPDPRDDLSGMDVARKAVILAREMGMPMELEPAAVESLVPGELAGVSHVDAFLDGLAAHDHRMEARRAEAESAGERLRYVAVIEPPSTMRVGLHRYPAAHPFAGLTGSDNIIAFHTERYHEQPLIVRGPGAGPEVTAGGVFADLLRLAAYLGAPS